MFIDKRREDRFGAELAIAMVLRRREDGGAICGPLAADIVDISKYGARLFMESIRLDAFHLFYTPRDQETSALFLEGTSASAEAFSVPVWPIWFDRLLLEDAKPFQMGVEFLLHPHDDQVEKLLRLARRPQGEPRSLLSRFRLSKLA